MGKPEKQRLLKGKAARKAQRQSDLTALQIRVEHEQARAESYRHVLRLISEGEYGEATQMAKDVLGFQPVPPEESQRQEVPTVG